MTEFAEFVPIGFSELGTGSQDYGNGVVRLHRDAPATIPELAGIGRNDLLRIENRNHDRVYAIARFCKGATRNLIGLEYDARRRLDLKKGEASDLQIKRARRIEYFGYLWGHPNHMVRIEFRLAIYIGIASFLLGVAASAIA